MNEVRLLLLSLACPFFPVRLRTGCLVQGCEAAEARVRLLPAEQGWVSERDGPWGWAGSFSYLSTVLKEQPFWQHGRLENLRRALLHPFQATRRRPSGRTGEDAAAHHLDPGFGGLVPRREPLPGVRQDSPARGRKRSRRKRGRQPGSASPLFRAARRAANDVHGPGEGRFPDAARRGFRLPAAGQGACRTASRPGAVAEKDNARVLVHAKPLSCI